MNYAARLVCGITVVSWSLFAGAPSAAAEVYKWKDEDGNVHYSASPPPGEIDSEPVDTTEGGASAEALKRINVLRQQLNKSDQRQAKEAEVRQKKQDFQQIKEENCAKSRDKLITLQQARRLRAVDESGNVTRATAEEHKARIKAAEANIEKWCD
ncbi:MAG TPA: DUF4124 domain-containing protein [Gammaproteobacteria bacterium]|nr:DUF4124 domain-containing protein [Gammaproteobacteria bacterium]